jgi:hypothetical protein
LRVDAQATVELYEQLVGVAELRETIVGALPALAHHRSGIEA